MEFTVVKSTLSRQEPPRPLNAEGRKVWSRFSASYDFADVAGSELLCQICEAVDLLTVLSASIEENGALIHTRAGGLKCNPAIREVTGLRAFITRSIHRLGLNNEAIGPMGRPPGPQRHAD
jgi:hypothetical protein